MEEKLLEREVIESCLQAIPVNIRRAKMIGMTDDRIAELTGFTWIDVKRICGQPIPSGDEDTDSF